MAKVGAQRAAVLTGRSKSTIQRAMNCGKLSYEIDANDRRVIDVSELERVFGIKQMSVQAPVTTPHTDIESPAMSIEQAVEKEHLSMRVKMLEQQLQTANDYIGDLKDQRDKWEKQASQVLITSQYSQRQAEELREHIKKREERARLRRQQIEGGMTSSQEVEYQNYSPSRAHNDDSGTSKSQEHSAEPSKKRDPRKLEEQLKKLKAQNENETDQEMSTTEDIGQSVFRFWKRVKG